MNRSRKRWWPAAASLLLVFALPLPSALAQEDVPGDLPYRHEPAAAVYPVRVGEFERIAIRRYDTDGKDVSASYSLATPKGRLVVTVYIYPAAPAVPAGRRGGGMAGARSALCEEEFGNVKNAIASQHGGALPIEEGFATKVPRVDAGLTHRAVYRFRISFDGVEQEVRSEAHLYCYVGGDWFVKYRISAPLAVESRAAVERFIRRGPWPGRASVETIAKAREEPPHQHSVGAP